jgi:uncharacterized protein (TIGR02001 family)
MRALPTALFLAMLIPTAAQAGDWGGIFSFIDLTSDYRFQGVSNTDGNASVQGNVHYWRPDGYYAGIFASQVDFKDPGHTSYELDYYGGKNFEFGGGKTELKLQGMYSVFPNNRTPGPTYDFATAEVAVSHVAGKLTTHALGAFVPEGSYHSGKIWRVEGEADYALRPYLTLRALIGDQWGGRGHARAYWSLGGTATWKTLGFELRYVGTDRTRENCGFLPKVCDPTVVGTLTVNLPPIL